MVKRFNVNGPEDDDSVETLEHQDIINYFYRVGLERVHGLKAYPTRGKATLEYDVDYLNLLFKGKLYSSELRNHPDLPKDPPPRFVFDAGDVKKAIARYHRDGVEGNLLPASQNLCLHEFLFRKYGSQKRVRIMAPFLYYFFENRELPLYSGLNSDERYVIDYVMEKWPHIEGARPIDNRNDLVELPFILEKFTETFGDVIPLRQRYGVYGDHHSWPLSCLELILDDFLDVIQLLSNPAPATLVSKKVWGRMFMRELRQVTGLGTECLPDWEDLEQVDISSCWCLR